MAAIWPAPSWLRRPAFAAAALAIVLSGCSMSQELANAPHPGLQQDGTYVVSQQEQDMGCRALQERSLGLQEHMQTLSVQALDQMQQLPSTVVAGWKRLVGAPGDGVPAIAEYNQARAESAALTRTMTSKGCIPGTTASNTTTPSATTPSMTATTTPSTTAWSTAAPSTTAWSTTAPSTTGSINH
jgi:hypothetical protein